MTKPPGWHAQLKLDIERREKESIIKKSRQKGPLTFQKPFYPEGSSSCHIYLLHPPAGVVGGDRLNLDAHLGTGASAVITTPGAGKFYRSQGETAELVQHFFLEEGATLEWLPQETIYYPGSKAHLQTRVELSFGAVFLGWELHCLGLPVNGKSLEDGRVRIGFSIYREGVPLLLENLLISPEKNEFQAALLRGNQIFGTMIASGADSELLQNLRLHFPETEELATTLIEDLLIIRYLGNNMLVAREFFIEMWKFLRPQITGLQPDPPRIWAT